MVVTPSRFARSRSVVRPPFYQKSEGSGTRPIRSGPVQFLQLQPAPDPEPTTTAADANSTGFMAVINVLICPSDPAPTTLVPIGDGNYAMHNYPMCTGSNYSVVQNSTGNLIDIVPNGVLFENSAISPAAITDGTSNT